MTHRSSLKLLLAVAVVAAFGTPGASATPAITPACRGGDLIGAFRAVAGSAGAGSISYKLELRNVSRGTCFVSGIPRMVLLRANGAALPTHVSPAHPGELTAVLVRLARGKIAAASARFTPDVPGPGEQVVGRCELAAYKLRVTPNGGRSVVVPVVPPTPVCVHGRMSFTVLTGAP